MIMKMNKDKRKIIISNEKERREEKKGVKCKENTLESRERNNRRWKDEDIHK